MILRDCIVVVSDYLFFLFVEHTSNGLEDFKVIFMLLIEIFHLQMISYLFSFWKDSIIGYIVAFIVFFYSSNGVWILFFNGKCYMENLALFLATYSFI